MDEAGRRGLEVRYETAEDFRRDYDTNLSHRGVFVASEEAFAVRDRVIVRLVLDFAAEAALELEGEVVHTVSQEVAALGGKSGVAVQFRESIAKVRELLAPLLEHAGSAAEPPADERRAAPRKPARVSATIESEEATLEGSTRDISQGGALIGVQQGSVPVGESVRLALRHPTTGETLEVDGRVVRGVESEGRLAAVAVEFTPQDTERESVEHFLDDVQNVEQVRRLGGIRGTLADLDIQSLVMMFSGAAPAGTLVVRHGGEEGIVGFEAGELRVAQLGPASGMKALVRLLAWTEGHFEFHPRCDDAQSDEAPLPLEESLVEALGLVEEGAFVDARRFPPQAELVASPGGDPDDDLSKLEAAVLDVARAGFTVQHALDVIPEPDVEIYRALEALAEQELLDVRARS